MANVTSPIHVDHVSLVSGSYLKREKQGATVKKRNTVKGLTTGTGGLQIRDVTDNLLRDPVEEENYFILILKQEEPVVIVNRIGRHTTGLPSTSVLNRSHPDHVKRDNILHTM